MRVTLRHGAGKQQSIVFCAIPERVIGAARSQWSESVERVKSACGMVLLSHFKKDARGVPGFGKRDEVLHERGRNALPLSVRVCGDGKDFAFVGNQLRDQPALRVG